MFWEFSFVINQGGTYSLTWNPNYAQYFEWMNTRVDNRPDLNNQGPDKEVVTNLFLTLPGIELWPFMRSAKRVTTKPSWNIKTWYLLRKSFLCAFLHYACLPPLIGRGEWSSIWEIGKIEYEWGQLWNL